MKHKSKTLIQLAALSVWLWGIGLAKAAPPDAALLDIAPEVGVAETTVAYHVSVADYDRNGFPDFLFNRRWALPFRLYQNIGGVFVEDKRTNFGIRDRLDCEWGDPNIDGRPDFYCTRGANYGSAVKANELWIQQGDGTFKEQAATWNVIDRYGRGRQVAWLNYDSDRFPDLFVGNDYPRVDGIPSPNRLFVNQAGTSFREANIPEVTAEIGAVCAFATDIDRDGFDDLLVCGNRGLRIYRNTDGTGFVDMAPGLRLTGYASDAFAADLTGDGLPDLVLVTSGAVKIFPWTGEWRLGAPQSFSLSWPGSKAVAADIDGDHDLDIYVSTNATGSAPNPADLLLRNRGNGLFDREVVGTSTDEGKGGRCAAIDHDSDGHSGVLVVNSNDSASTTVGGPLQLMSQYAASPPPTNLLVNAGFETGRLTPWMSWPGDSGLGGLRVVATQVRSGNWAGTVPAASGGAQRVAVSPGVRYTVSAYGKVDVSHWAAVSYRFLDTAGKTIDGGKDLSSFSTAYEQRRVSFTTPPNTRTIVVQLWNRNGGNLYVDDFTLTSP